MKTMMLALALMMVACGSEEGWRYINASEAQRSTLDCALAIAAEEGSSIAGGEIEVRHWSQVVGIIEAPVYGDRWIVSAQDDSSVNVSAQVLAQKLVDEPSRPLVMTRVYEECPP